MRVQLSAFVILMLVLGFKSHAQIKPAVFENQFLRLAKAGFTKSDVSAFLENYTYVAVSGLPKSKLYTRYIEELLEDTAEHKNRLGCYLVTASNDTMKTGLLEKLIVRSKYEYSLPAICLLTLKSKNITPVIRTIDTLKNYPSGGLLIDYFLMQDQAILDEFVTDSMNSKSALVRMLCCQAMRYGKLTEDKLSKLIHVVSSDDNNRGHAIATLAALEAPEMSGLLRQYLNISSLRGVIYRAISNSTSVSDTTFIDSLVNSNPYDFLLNLSLKISSNSHSQRKWLDLVSKDLLIDGIYPFIEKTPLISNDSLFDAVCTAIKKSQNKKRIYPLFEYFVTRKDEKSTSFLLECLDDYRDYDIAIMYIVRGLKDRSSGKIEDAFPLLMNNTTSKHVYLVELLSEYNNYNYKDVVASWMKTPMDTASKEMCEKYINH